MANHSFTAQPGTTDIISTYTFEAPREKVFAAYLKPELIPQWWGPEGMQTKVEKMDPRTGGSWEFAVSGSEGDFRFRGVYPDQAVFQSVEDRDAMLKNGMDGGSVDSMERLARLIDHRPV